MKSCSVHDCKEPLGSGDIYFCELHRKAWRKSVKLMDIEDTSQPPLKESAVHPYFMYFIKNGELLTLLNEVDLNSK